jgi:hypothetical protein
MEDKPLKLTCKVTGVPRPEITWLKDNKDIFSVSQPRLNKSLSSQLKKKYSPLFDNFSSCHTFNNDWCRNVSSTSRVVSYNFVFTLMVHVSLLYQQRT